MEMIESVSTDQLHHFLGANPVSNMATRFNVWAPGRERVALFFPENNRIEPMQRSDSGYFFAEVGQCEPGTRYFYRLDGELDRPDPASRYQPDGVHGPSQVVATDYPWTDSEWSGIDLNRSVIYELHIATFTTEGTFVAAIDRLDELVGLGITAIELMPLADAAGRWNWGYDGVCLFAPNNNYGSPRELKRLVDAAHQKGLAVILDVVYNHLGPEGNYLADFGPYFSAKHSTPWGEAPSFDDSMHGDAVRRFFLANAIYWLDEFHFDGLRVDAIHCTKDDSDPHIVAEISDAVDGWSAKSARNVALIAESNVYDREMLTPRSESGIGFDAQWCDDFLHSLFAAVRPDEQLCHRNYVPRQDLAQTLRYGYVYQGSMRQVARREQPKSRVDTSRLIYSIQNHDFVGNHPIGQRFHQLTSIETQKAAAALLILSPAIPMLFMGEEFACDSSFRFFVDFADRGLRDAVDQGRRREYPQHDWSRGLLPTDSQTFFESRIGTKSSGNPEMWQWYQSLIRLRQDWVTAGLLLDQHLTVETELEYGLYCLRYSVGATTATVAVRLNSDPNAGDVIDLPREGQVVLDSRSDQSTAGLLPNHAVISIRET